MDIFLAFGVHVGDMALGPRPKMSEWAQQLNDRFASAELRAKVLCWFRQTGNFAVDAAGEALTEIREHLMAITGTSWILICLPQLEQQITGARSASPPPVEPQTRWTRGLAFRVDHINLTPAAPASWITNHGIFEQVTNQIVRVWKRDPLTERDTLERRRRPPWGTISRDCSKRLDGIWTARSLSTLEGVVTRLRKNLEDLTNRLQPDRGPRAVLSEGEKTRWGRGG